MFRHTMRIEYAGQKPTHQAYLVAKFYEDENGDDVVVICPFTSPLKLSDLNSQARTRYNALAYEYPYTCRLPQTVDGPGAYMRLWAHEGDMADAIEAYYAYKAKKEEEKEDFQAEIEMRDKRIEELEEQLQAMEVQRDQARETCRRAESRLQDIRAENGRLQKKLNDIAEITGYYPPF